MLAFSILSLQPHDWFVTLALLPHQHPPGPHEVFKIYKETEPLLVQGTALWTLYSTEAL